MASITSSVANMVAFGGSGIGGISASYDLKTFGDAKALGTEVYPCLVAAPDLGQQTGWQTLAMMSNAPTLEFVVEHWLLLSKVAGSGDITVIMPSITALIDGYFAALKANPLMSVSGVPASHYPMPGGYKVSKIGFAGVQYHSVVFQFKMKLNL